MDIKFYNSLTNRVEPFITNEPNKVSMYVCGPTVYNDPHIGNMRPVVVFDVLRRFLTYVGYNVTYVSNYTDIDDKIIKAAKEKGVSEKELTEHYIKEFEKAVKGIGSLIPSITPKVSEYIEKIIAYVDNLVKIGAAYVVDGDVYFRVSTVKDYGCLSGINIEDLKVGARIEKDERKESPLDFALWKKTTEGISWPSPWGNGRPGWHTECCVMIDTIFPSHFIDIHGGGYDLKFPHHENEIAQSEATHHNKIAKYWMHNGFVNFGEEKMSKSLGNVVTAKDILASLGGPVTRMIILSAHYRQPVNYTDETLLASKQQVNKLTNAYRQLALKLQTSDIDMNEGKVRNIEPFLSALADDLNTSNALSEVYELVKLANNELRNRECNLSLLNDYFKTLTDMFYILGLDIAYVKLSEEDKQLFKEYNLSKQNRDFAKSDEIRQLLIERGIF